MFSKLLVYHVFIILYAITINFMKTDNNNTLAGSNRYLQLILLFYTI